MRKTKVALMSGAILLVGSPVWGQQTAAPATAGVGDAIAHQMLNGGGSGYGAAQMFSPFPKDEALLPLSQRVPGLLPAIEAPRPLGVMLGVRGEEELSDNVYSTASSKKADVISSVDPLASVNVDDRLLTGGANFDLGYDKYAANPHLDGYRQNGIGIFDAELIENRLFVDGRASVSEEGVSPLGPVTAGSRTAASNLVRVYTASIAPRLQQRFDDVALAQLSVYHDETRNENASQITPVASSPLSAAGLDDSRSDGGRFEVRSGEAFTRLLWDYTGDIDRDSSTGSTFDQVSQTVGSEYRMTTGFGLLTAGGDDYLHSNYINLSKYGGAYYDVGFHWAPSPSTDLRIGGGRRYGRADWIVSGFHWLGPRTVVRVSENSGLTTDALSFEGALNAVQRDDTGSFVNPFTGLAADPSASPLARSNAIYWQRNSTVILRHDFASDALSLTASIVEQRLLGVPNGVDTAALASVTNGTAATVLEADLAWTHQFTLLTFGQAILSQSRTMVTQSTIGSSKQLRGGLSMNYKMNPSLFGTFGYSMAATLSDSLGNIRENLITVGLRKTF